MRLADIPIWQADPESKTLTPITSALLLYGLGLARTSLEQDDETDAALDAAEFALTSGATIMSPKMIEYGYILPSGTDGGNSSAGYNFRPLNTLVRDDTGQAALSGSVMTLPLGRYWITAIAQAANDHSQTIHLRPYTSSSDVLPPSGGWLNAVLDSSPAYAAADRGTHVVLSGGFVVDDSRVTDYAIWYRASVARTNGLGRRLAISGVGEKYLSVALMWWPL